MRGRRCLECIAAIVIILATVVGPALAKKPLHGIPLEWKPTTGIGELGLVDLTGMSYNPLTQEYKLGTDVSVNYLACFRKA